MNEYIKKRDYAVILLASRLGLRSSDIRMLEFKNIDWDLNEIRIMQHKTKRSLSLPLLSDVGDAIIDYIKNGLKKHGMLIPDEHVVKIVNVILDFLSKVPGAIIQ